MPLKMEMTKGGCVVCGVPLKRWCLRFAGGLCSQDCADKYQRLHSEGRAYRTHRVARGPQR